MCRRPCHAVVNKELPQFSQVCPSVNLRHCLHTLRFAMSVYSFFSFFFSLVSFSFTGATFVSLPFSSSSIHSCFPKYFWRIINPNLGLPTSLKLIAMILALHLSPTRSVRFVSLP